MKKHKIRRRLPRAALAVALACAALLADGRFRLVTTRYSLSSPRLPEQFDGFTIVQLSDLHGACFGEGNARLVERVRRETPDVIAITGDLADENTDMAVIDTLLGALAAEAPVYYVSGNHEWSASLLPALEPLFEKHGVRYLRNECVVLERGGAELVLAGVEDPNGWRDMYEPDEVVDIIQENHPGTFTILLGHRNYWADKYPELPVDIIFCGHAHGGDNPPAGARRGTGHGAGAVPRLRGWYSQGGAISACNLARTRAKPRSAADFKYSGACLGYSQVCGKINLFIARFRVSFFPFKHRITYILIRRCEDGKRY